MHAPDEVLLFLGFLRPAVGSAPLARAIPAYIGLGPGQELIPYFFVLLGIAAVAAGAVLQWPLLTIARFLFRTQRGRPVLRDSMRVGSAQEVYPRDHTGQPSCL